MLAFEVMLGSSVLMKYVCTYGFTNTYILAFEVMLGSSVLMKHKYVCIFSILHTLLSLPTKTECIWQNVCYNWTL